MALDTAQAILLRRDRPKLQRCYCARIRTYWTSACLLQLALQLAPLLVGGASWTAGDLSIRGAAGAESGRVAAAAARISTSDHRSAAALRVRRKNCGSQHIPALFNFGDSNSDTGGLGAAFGPPPPPHGLTTFHKPSGRFCDGRLLIDFIAEELGMPYLDAYLQSVGSNFRRGANFATAGSTIRVQNTTLAQSGFSPFSLGVQVTQFAEFKQRTLTFHTQEPFSSLLPQPHYFDEGLYVVDIGQNDLTAGYFLNLTLHQVRDSIPQVLKEFADHIKALHEHGAKKFVIVTTGPVGCLPYILTRLAYTPAEVDRYGCATPYNKMARVFNKQLSTTIRNLQLQLQLKATFVIVDGYNLKYNLFINARKDGFQFTVKACCGYGGGPYNFNTSMGYCGSKPKVQSMLKKHLSFNLCPDPSAYVNWDGVHYSEAANHAMARGLFSGNFTTPKFSSGHFCDLFA